MKHKSGNELIVYLHNLMKIIHDKITAWIICSIYSFRSTQRDNMQKYMILGLVILYVSVIPGAQAQSNSSIFIWPSLEDADIRVSVDKSTYFAGDTIYLSIRSDY
jgi:hypothetical protein